MNNLITWSCCTDCKEPDWRVYDALELAGVVMHDNGVDGLIVERVDDEVPQFYSLYGHLKSGGCDALHDFEPTEDLVSIRQQCRDVALRIGFVLYDFS